MSKATENALVITQKYPPEKFNLLVPIQTVAEISEIQKPVLSVVYISTDLEDKEIYEREKEYTDKKTGIHYPAKYAIAKKGLTKLMKAAGITILSIESVVPTTCQKCANINASIGKPVHCGSCSNKDVRCKVTILVPTLTGKDTRVEATKEIIVADVISDMTENQKKEFLKYRSEICEAKALNRALREAMQIKSSYTLEELQKPFVVAYLVPNLDHQDVRAKAIDSYFASTSALFGGNSPESYRTIVCEDDEAEPAIGQAPQADIPQIESPVPEPEEVNVPLKNTPPDPNICTDCGAKISDEVSDFSIRWYKTPLCRHCQDKRRGAR